MAWAVPGSGGWGAGGAGQVDVYSARLRSGETAQHMVDQVGCRVFGPDGSFDIYMRGADGLWRLSPGDPVNTPVDASNDDVLVAKPAAARERASEEGAGALSTAEAQTPDLATVRGWALEIVGYSLLLRFRAWKVSRN